MTIQPFSEAIAKAELRRFYQQTPLVHCMTNEVVQAFTANALLAVGASPAMVVATAEVRAFAQLADVLLINVGTLYPTRDEAMRYAVDAAMQAHKPWVLDPVAVGVLDYRSDFCQQLLSKRPTAIRGNASEIIALSGGKSANHGVESGDSSTSAIQSASLLAQRTGAIVAVTGAVDYITDGRTIYAIERGHVLMTRVVGTGCVLSAWVAALLAKADQPILAVASACLLFAMAGEQAVLASRGPGSFMPAFLDALHDMKKLVT
ncbi:MAG: hydroxyethylthiazole kinase [Neisseriales bacterium]|nr:MAG: hydroxyethylthiazole kinase [Neisseriales bacterium]